MADTTPTGRNTPSGLVASWQGSRGRTVVLFGGNPARRDEVVRLLGARLDVTVVGTLSEAEGMATLDALGDAVAVVLIGGAYSTAQRERIRQHVRATLPGRAISEPGFAYPYANEAIVGDIADKLALLR